MSNHGVLQSFRITLRGTEAFVTQGCNMSTLCQDKSFLFLLMSEAY